MESDSSLSLSFFVLNLQILRGVLMEGGGMITMIMGICLTTQFLIES